MLRPPKASDPNGIDLTDDDVVSSEDDRATLPGARREPAKTEDHAKRLEAALEPAIRARAAVDPDPFAPTVAAPRKGDIGYVPPPAPSHGPPLLSRDVAAEDAVAGECLASIGAQRGEPRVGPSADLRTVKLPAVQAAPVRAWPSLPADPIASSIPPVSSAQALEHGEPTVIILRARPKAWWILGAALLGASVAAAAMIVLGPAARGVASVRPTVASGAPVDVAPPRPSAMVPAPLPPTPSASAVVAPPPVAPASAGPAANVVRFGEDQAPAIVVAPRASSHSAAAAPAAPVPSAGRARAHATERAASSPPSNVPQSSKLTLGGTPSESSAPPARSASPAHTRVLTPDELADAQLKASMK